VSWAIAALFFIAAAAYFMRGVMVTAADRLLAPLDTWISARRSGEVLLGGLLLAPAFAVLIVFSFLPIGFAVYLSLFDVRRGSGPFVGLGNYTRALGSDTFWHSASVTAWYALLYIPAALVVSFLLASGLRRLRFGRGLLRTAYFLPFVTSTVAAATVWRIMLHPRYGTIGPLMESLGMPAAWQPDWLLDPRGVLHWISGGAISPAIGPSIALCCVIVFEVWRATGFMTVVLLAGMSAIPRELEEAARLDGAGAFALSRHVTLPLLSPILFFLVVVSGIHAFQAFDAIYALTGDGHGPLGATRTMTIYLYGEFYENGREGYGAAVAVLLCVFIIGLTALQWRVLGRQVHYR
jgi:ABC-type sugar transport system permease subunit